MEHKFWFRSALQIRGSVIPSIVGRTSICGLFGILVSVLHAVGYPVSVPTLASLIPNIVLGLLLVFRTNTAYDRFWEGRKIWGNIINTTRNLARNLWIMVPAKTVTARDGKIRTLRMLVAFAVATKLHLRQRSVNDELAGLLAPEKFEKLKSMNHPPLEVAFWIGDYVQDQYRQGEIDGFQLTAIQKDVSELVNSLGACERILKTPMPLAYSIHLKQLLLLYCLSLPFQMVASVGWWTGPIVALISFTLFGIEAIGIEIENPFGCDPNDLPLDAICDTMLRNINDLITLAPCMETCTPELPPVDVRWR
jgi:putative membrane protein